MASHEQAVARRVITGLTATGSSGLQTDDLATSRLVTPGNTKCDIWRVPALPAPVNDGDGLDAGVITTPDPGGLVYRVVTIPSDSEWDMSQGYNDVHGALPGMIADTDIPGLHETETVDIVTVISGQLHAVMETGEVLLHPGDSLVQRGTRHAWNNRTAEPAVIVALMVSAVR